MAQRKTEVVFVCLEPDLRSIVQLLLNRESSSASGYFRKLAIEDLKRQGLLTDEILTKITVG